MPHPKGDDFTQPKPITHQAAWALLHERPDICEKHIWNQITRVAKGKISQRRPGLWLVKARQVYISKDSACSREIYMQGPQSISLIDG